MRSPDVGPLAPSTRLNHRRFPGGAGDAEGCDSSEQEGGFALAEIIAAMLILIVVVVSLSGLLTNSLSAALLVKQRETAASLASDMIENAKALGETQLADASPGKSACTNIGSAVVLPRTAATIQQCYDLYIDNFEYAVNTKVVNTVAAPESTTAVSIWVTWSSNSATAPSAVTSCSSSLPQCYSTYSEISE